MVPLGEAKKFILLVPTRLSSLDTSTMPKSFKSMIIFLICGFDKEQMDPQVLEKVMKFTPAGTSAK